jgi:hypothetical protein
VIVLVLCSIAIRMAMWGIHSSDVSDVTRVATWTALVGDNPYGIGYAASSPPGAPFPYGPVVLLWYLPWTQNPVVVELAVSIGLLIAFGIRAGRGRPLGLAIFALAPPLVLAGVDGSNDTSAGLLIMLALIAAARKPILGAVLLAVAVAFKPYAAAWVPPLIFWAGLPAMLSFAVASVVAWSPVLFVWGPSSYLTSLAMAQETHLRNAYWSLGAILDPLSDTVARALETIRYFVSGAVALILGTRARTSDHVILVGSAVFLIAQFGGYFGSYVYLAALAPILCWRVDDWLHRALPEVARAYGDLPGAVRRVRLPAHVASEGVSAMAAMRDAPSRGHRAGPSRIRIDRAAGSPID